MALRIFGALVLVYIFSRLCLALVPKRIGRLGFLWGHLGCGVALYGGVLIARLIYGSFSLSNLEVYMPAQLVWVIIDALRLPSRSKGPSGQCPSSKHLEQSW